MTTSLHVVYGAHAYFRIVPEPRLERLRHYMSDMFSPAQALYLRLLRELQALGLQSGDHLPSETDLAARLGVGRPQVREALRMLEAIGTVRSRQGARRVWLGFRTSVFAQ